MPRFAGETPGVSFNYESKPIISSKDYSISGTISSSIGTKDNGAPYPDGAQVGLSFKF